jgi:hypothetical protein
MCVSTLELGQLVLHRGRNLLLIWLKEAVSVVRFCKLPMESGSAAHTQRMSEVALVVLDTAMVI